MSLQLAEAAKRLGADSVLMDSYWKYHEREQNWFFSPNSNLDNAQKRPASFPTEGDWQQLSSKDRQAKWQALSSRQRMTICSLAGFGYEGRGINLDNSHHFARLRAGYNQWRPDLFSVFWSDENNGKRWLCNVFVGDAIYLLKEAKFDFTSFNKHYYDPKQIASGQSSLKKRRSHKDVQVGDIVVFGNHHVEIITELKKDYWLADDGFCAVGAGRGAPHTDKKGDGQVKCDTYYAVSFRDTRELGDKNNSYFYL